MANKELSNWDKFLMLALEALIKLNNEGHRLVFTAGSKSFDIDNMDNGKSISLSREEFNKKEIWNDELLDRLLHQVGIDS